MNRSIETCCIATVGPAQKAERAGLAPVAHRAMRRVGALLMAGVEVLQVWRERALQRAQLASLDDRMLADIGVGRPDVVREAEKPFWRP